MERIDVSVRDNDYKMIIKTTLTRYILCWYLLLLLLLRLLLLLLLLLMMMLLMMLLLLPMMIPNHDDDVNDTLYRSEYIFLVCIIIYTLRADL